MLSFIIYHNFMAYIITVSWLSLCLRHDLNYHYTLPFDCHSIRDFTQQKTTYKKSLFLIKRHALSSILAYAFFIDTISFTIALSNFYFMFAD